jgi:hypothetical protein
MAVALSTTKRKFHKILDSISNASSTSLASTHKYNASTTTLPATFESPAKRTKLARPASAYVTPSKRVTASSAPCAPAAAVARQPVATMNNEKNAPNFTPWDRTQFLERLKTYRYVEKWMGKPDKISEVQWAKRGWSCVGRDTVECVGGCGKRVVILLQDSREEKENQKDRTQEEEDDEEEWREKAQEELVDKYAAMIAAAHDGGCLWRRKGCDDTIQRLPLVHQSTAIEALRLRYQSLLVMASELPLKPSTPEGFDIASIISHIAPLIQSSPLGLSNSPPRPTPLDPTVPPVSPTRAPPPPPAPINHSALSLALFGWEAEEGHISGLATCHACFRRLGLWLFKPSSETGTSSMDRLDVIGEHRDYCPWINAVAQCGTEKRRMALDGMSGWQVLVNGINARGRNRSQDPFVRKPDERTDWDDEASEVASVKSLAQSKEEREEVETKDKERWAKLKKLKQVFHVRRKKGGTPDKKGEGTTG